MIQKIIVALAALIVAAAAAGGGWWFAAERGWIPGKPNSPRPENFKAALDAHLKRSNSPHNRPCAPVNAQRPQDGMGPKDVRWDWSPASFRAVLDPRRPSYDRPERRFAYLAKQGFFTEKALADGTTEYLLTWKGMAASTGQSCFAMASSDRAAEVLSFTKKRTENGIDIYEVVARVQLTNVEPWAKAPEFLEAFGKQQFQRYFEPQPVAYELARGEQGFEVIAEQGRPAQARMGGAVQPALLAKLAGGVTAERVKAALETWAAGQGAAQMRICLRPPEQHEADEVTQPQRAYGVMGAMAAAESPTYTYYNLLMRPQHNANPLRGYLILRKFETLGFARSELLPASDFRGQPAAGAVKFTLLPAFLDRFAPNRERCWPVGTAQVAEVVKFDPIGESSLTPQFIARASIKPWDEEAKKVIEAFPHLQRAQEVGGVIRGSLQYYDNELRVTSGHAQFPMYHPDAAEAKLPVVEPPPPPKGVAPQKGAPQKSAPVQRIAPPQYQLPQGMPQLIRPAPMQVVPAPGGGLQQRQRAVPQ